MSENRLLAFQRSDVKQRIVSVFNKPLANYDRMVTFIYLKLHLSTLKAEAGLLNSGSA